MTRYADKAVVDECRAAVLDWMQEAVGDALPRRAWRLRSFAHRGDSAVCEAVRCIAGGVDYWAAQVIKRPDANQESVSEIVIAPHSVGDPPSIFVRVQDWSAVPCDMAAHYPSGALAAMSEKTTLLQEGKRMSSAPIEVKSEPRMEAFSEFSDRLVDPGRTLPFAALSVASYVDRETQEEEWGQAARALTGLAVTWVLHPNTKPPLINMVGEELSVFDGGWRFYRPGFNHNSWKKAHPLIIRRHLNVPEAIRYFVRMAAEERIGSVPDGWLTFDDVRRMVPRDLITRLKGAWVVLTSPGHAVSEPPADPYDHDNVLERLQKAEAERDKVRQRLKETEAEREKIRKRLQEADVKRDEADERAKRLERLMHIQGGDVDAPFPTVWHEFADWSDQTLGTGLVIVPSARRELSGAAFADVGLAAICLHWLAEEYRQARLTGNNLHLRGAVPGTEGVFNRPCGGDAFNFTLPDGRRLTAEWHLKNGGNTRDPKRCLRIYYAWDEQTRRVVVASMPGHRKTGMS